MSHPTTPPTVPRPRGRYLVFAIACIAAGAALRVAFAVRCGVGYDEVFVMGRGLEELLASARAFLIDVPVRRSDGITPLWWWVQAVPARMAGHVSLIGLRVLPVLLGVATLVLIAWKAPGRLGRRSAAILLLIVATSDVLAFCNARGEFAESLLMLLVWPALFRVGDPRRPVRKGLLWLLLLMTHLGKGLFLVAGLGAAEMVHLALRRRRGRGAGALALSTVVAVAPVVAWLWVANGLAFNAGPVETDAGRTASIWQGVVGITAKYGNAKAHMMAGPFAASQVYLDGMVWPGSVWWTVPLLAGGVTSLVPMLRGGRRGRRRVLALSLVPWVVAGAWLVIGGGMVGSRFHLLYWPAAWGMAALGLPRLLWRGGRGVLLCLALVWSAHVVLAFSWRSWIDRTLGVQAVAVVIGLVLLVAMLLLVLSRGGRGTSPGHRLRRVVGAVVLTVVGVGCLSGWGAIAWGPAARFEPMDAARPTVELRLLADIDAYRGRGDPWPAPHGRTLYIDLAHFHLSRADRELRDVEQAIAYVERELRRRPDDARAWFYLGLALQEAGAPVAPIREAWQRSYDLDPQPRVAERLAALPPE